jgi:hypothetical protein
MLVDSGVNTPQFVVTCGEKVVVVVLQVVPDSVPPFGQEYVVVDVADVTAAHQLFVLVTQNATPGPAPVGMSTRTSTSELPDTASIVARG